MKNDPIPSDADVRQALRVLVRGYLDVPDEGDVRTLRVTTVAWGHVLDLLNRLRLDPAETVDEPGQVHVGGCGKVG